MSAQIAGHLAASGGVPHHDGVLEIQRFEESREIVRVRVHLIAVPGLAGPPVATPVVRNDAIAALPEEEHLPVPVVRRQRPSMRKNDRLPFAPILVENLRPVLRCYRRHLLSSF